MRCALGVPVTGAEMGGLRGKDDGVGQSRPRPSRCTDMEAQRNLTQEVLPDYRGGRSRGHMLASLDWVCRVVGLSAVCVCVAALYSRN